METYSLPHVCGNEECNKNHQIFLRENLVKHEYLYVCPACDYTNKLTFGGPGRWPKAENGIPEGAIVADRTIP